MLLKNGNALIFSRNGFVPQDIRIEGAKITAMADTLAPLPGEEVVDASDCHITPGLIDAHSHICISEEGGGSEGDDCCDYSGTSTPELEVLDGLYPFDRAVKDCVRAGVTSCCVCPGSDGVVGGVASTIRLTGCVPDEMIVRRMTAMKCSVGENPKKANYSFCSRMGVAYQLRKSFDDALEYKYCKEEATKAGTHFHKDRGMEHMLLVLNKEMPVHMHAHRSDDICTAIRLAQEFDFDLVIIHGTDAIPIVDYLAKFDLIAFCGAAFLLLANVIFQSPIQDLNTFAAAVVSVLFLVVGLTIINGCQNPILVRHRLHKAGLYNHEGQAPWLIRQSRDPDNKKIMLLEFENQGIPRETWQEQKEALEAALNIFIIKIIDGKDRRHVTIHAVPANQGIPKVLAWTIIADDNDTPISVNRNDVDEISADFEKPTDNSNISEIPEDDNADIQGSQNSWLTQEQMDKIADKESARERDTFMLAIAQEDMETYYWGGESQFANVWRQLDIDYNFDTNWIWGIVKNDLDIYNTFDDSDYSDLWIMAGALYDAYKSGDLKDMLGDDYQSVIDDLNSVTKRLGIFYASRKLAEANTR